MKSLIQKWLKILTYKVLAKQRPNIITITGSVGKTSTKEGIFYALKGLGSIRRSLKNYNNELGVPFTIALWNGKAPSANPFRWLCVFCRLIFYSLFKSKKYPKFLVLEVGSDKPNDLQYLMEMIPQGLLKIAVLTAVFGVHLEFFKTIEAIYQEKTTPFKYVAKNGLILVNADNCDIERIKKEFGQKERIVCYGFEKPARHNFADVGGPADITAFNFKTTENGLNFEIKTKKGNFQFLLNQAISAYQCYPILAGIACCLEMNIEPSPALQNLAQKPPMPGRMRLLKGINNSIIIDDTYNSSPQAVKYALKAMVDLANMRNNCRKIAVLGDMLELGENTSQFHQEIGKLAQDLGIENIFTFGEKAKTIAPAKKHFTSHQEAGHYLKNFIQPNDIVLVKGSQGVRMEKIVKAIMSQPENAKELLVRQSSEWS